MSPPLPTTPLVATDTTSTVPATLTSTGAPRVFTRGRLSLLTSPLLPTTLLVDTDTTSTGAPRVCTRGRLMPLSPTTSPPLPTTPLVAMDTTSTVPATLTSTGAPRVCTRGMPLAPATSMLTVMTATGTTARTPSMVSRSMGTRPTSTRTVTDTKRFRAMQRNMRMCQLLDYAYCIQHTIIIPTEIQ